MHILDYKKFVNSKVIYNEPVKVRGGCLVTRTNYKLNGENIPIYIQTPKLKSVNGIICNDSRTYIELELDKSHLQFYEFLTTIDELNTNITYSKSEEWFGKELPLEVVDDFYSTPIKINKTNKAPIVKFKIPFTSGKINCQIFNENLNMIDYNLVSKDTEVICILELCGIKYYKQRFECEWNVLQMKVHLNEKVKPLSCMINEDLNNDLENEDDSNSNIF